MPPGAPFNSFALPYPIRVDAFSAIAPSSEPHNAALHLLTHTHSDHITGLQAKSFSQQVICSLDAKYMLLRHEVYTERALHEGEYRSEHNLTFSHLKVDPWIGPDGEVFRQGSRDLLKVFAMNTPTTIELQNEKKVTITLFDANHCPGAVMCVFKSSHPCFVLTFRLKGFSLKVRKELSYTQAISELNRGFWIRSSIIHFFSRIWLFLERIVLWIRRTASSRFSKRYTWTPHASCKLIKSPLKSVLYILCSDCHQCIPVHRMMRIPA